MTDFAQETARNYCCPPRSSRSAWTCRTPTLMVIENAERFGLIAAAPAARARRARQVRSPTCVLVDGTHKTRKQNSACRLSAARRTASRSRDAGSGSARSGRFLRRAPARPAEAQNCRYVKRHADFAGSAAVRQRADRARPGAQLPRPARPARRNAPALCIK